MNRRQFIAGASVGVAAAASGYPKPAIAQGAREFKMVTIWPKGLPGLQSGADRVAQSITALSGGRLQVKVFPAGQLVGARPSAQLVDVLPPTQVVGAGVPPQAVRCGPPAQEVVAQDDEGDGVRDPEAMDDDTQKAGRGHQPHEQLDRLDRDLRRHPLSVAPPVRLGWHW